MEDESKNVDRLPMLETFPSIASIPQEEEKPNDKAHDREQSLSNSSVKKVADSDWISVEPVAIKLVDGLQSHRTHCRPLKITNIKGGRVAFAVRVNFGGLQTVTPKCGLLNGKG